MPSFILKRLASLVVQVFLVLVGIFLLLRVLPADPVSKFAGLAPGPEAKAQAERTLGIDTSIWNQLWTYIKQVFSGDFAHSWTSQAPIIDELKTHFPVTAQL